MLFTSSVNPFGLSNMFQIKVSLDIASVLTIFTLPCIDTDRFRDDQMLSVFLSLGKISDNFFFTGKFFIIWKIYTQGEDRLIA